MSRTTQIIASRSMRYGTRMLQAGDTFEAKDRDARLLVAIGRAKLAVQEAPIQKIVAPTAEEVLKISAALEAPSVPVIDALRAEYQQRTGSEPDRRWGIPRLSSEVAALRNAV